MFQPDEEVAYSENQRNDGNLENAEWLAMIRKTYERTARLTRIHNRKRSALTAMTWSLAACLTMNTVSK
jgi:hypothetical protein